MKGFLRAAASAVLPVLLVLSFDADAARIKDISSFQGVRTNQLMGYGLVVGLPGTGEKNNAFSEQTFLGQPQAQDEGRGSCGRARRASAVREAGTDH